jgi:hypothetical protein
VGKSCWLIQKTAALLLNTQSETKPVATKSHAMRFDLRHSSQPKLIKSKGLAGGMTKVVNKGLKGAMNVSMMAGIVG